MIVDIYTHIFPDRFFQELERGSPKLGNMGKRLRAVRKLFDLDLRFKDMDEIGETTGRSSRCPIRRSRTSPKARWRTTSPSVANDSMAELCAKHPDRFPAFAAAVSMHDVDFSIAEAERAIKMGARGVQTFTNIAGHPLDEPRFRPFFAAMAAHDLPIWLHPARTSAMPDYASEPRSRFEMWWCFGWPYETTVAMCAAGVRRHLRPASEAEDHHPPSRRRHDPVLRRPHRPRHGRCSAAAPSRRTTPRCCPR